MTDSSEAVGEVRVLALLPSLRYTGCAVLDGWGLDAFETWDLRPSRGADEKIREFTRRLVRSIRQHAPTAVVVSVPMIDTLLDAPLRAEVFEVARRFGVPVSVRPVAHARRLVLGRQRGRSGAALARQLVRGFFPTLAPKMHQAGEPARYRWHVWSALAVGLHELAERAPLAATALAQPEAFSVGRFGQVVSDYTRALHPVP